MFHRSVFLTLTVLLMGISDIQPASGAPEASSDDVKAQRFVSDHEARIRPLEQAAALAWWNANISGKDEDFAAKEEAQNRLDAALADRARFEELKALRTGRSTTRSSPARSRSSTCSTWRSRSTRLAPEDHRQGQRHREGVQRLSRHGRRPGDDRQRGPQGPQGVEGLGPAQGGLGGEQGGRPGRRGGPEGSWSSSATRRPHARASRTSTRCSSTSTSRARSRS